MIAVRDDDNDVMTVGTITIDAEFEGVVSIKLVGYGYYRVRLSPM